MSIVLDPTLFKNPNMQTIVVFHEGVFPQMKSSSLPVAGVAPVEFGVSLIVNSELSLKAILTE